MIMQATSFSPKRLFLGTGLFVLLFLMSTLAACGSGNSTSSKTPTSQSTAAGRPGASGTTPSVSPGTLLGVQPCPGATKNPAYWNPFIIPQSGAYKVESVSCANIVGTPALQA